MALTASQVFLSLGSECISLRRQLAGLFKEYHGSSDRKVFPVKAVSIKGPGTPNQNTLAIKKPYRVDGLTGEGVNIQWRLLTFG